MNQVGSGGIRTFPRLWRWSSLGERAAQGVSFAVLSGGLALNSFGGCRKTLRLAQDPNSQNLGTTVWDASIVLAKWLEKVTAPTRIAAIQS